jgi:tetratricopeptide (TPR) repeat protein
MEMNHSDLERQIAAFLRRQSANKAGDAQPLQQGDNKDRDIQQLIAQGEDEQIVRLIFLLLEIPQNAERERFDATMQLGIRYAVLAEESLTRYDLLAQGELARVVDRLIEAPEGAQGNLASLPLADQRAVNWYVEAIHYLSHAMRLFPQSPVAYMRRGLVYSAVHKFEAALSDFTIALTYATSQEEQASIYYLRGITHMLASNALAGIADFKLAVQLDGETLDYQEALFRAERQAE